MLIDRLSKLMGLVLGTAFGMALTAYGASEVVASGLRIVFP